MKKQRVVRGIPVEEGSGNVSLLSNRLTCTAKRRTFLVRSTGEAFNETAGTQPYCAH